MPSPMLPAVHSIRGIAPFPPMCSGHLGLKVYRAVLQQTLIDSSQVAALNKAVAMFSFWAADFSPQL